MLPSGWRLPGSCLKESGEDGWRGEAAFLGDAGNGDACSLETALYMVDTCARNGILDGFVAHLAEPEVGEPSTAPKMADNIADTQNAGCVPVDERQGLCDDSGRRRDDARRGAQHDVLYRLPKHDLLPFAALHETIQLSCRQEPYSSVIGQYARKRHGTGVAEQLVVVDA